ncbi:hypothetical protein [Amycolatopsis sp. H20-H5]|uniref:hypothetical protein n=1 Tax=Amycolatopsis sp. H20-H5 TaxID=3046309 RepID=UPI002DB904CE|nr:hypothetical protein [Amycolatopsis sp. H20-H5]MEC3978620.1 hypothetical protein [Amycolatopsis sp. H20-H5]
MNPLMVFLDAIRDHLDEHELPPASTVSVSTWSSPISVLLDVNRVAAVSSALLRWASTLDLVSASIMRTEVSGSVHLAVRGRTSCGVPIQVYGAVAFDDDLFPDLPRNIRQNLPLHTLRGWTDNEGAVA